MKKSKISGITFITLTLLFVLFIVLIKTVDVKTFFMSGTKIGFYDLNVKTFRKFGVSSDWEKVTDVLGIIVILAGCVFPTLALFQLFKRKSLKKVDKTLLIYIAVLVILGAVYVLFEIVKVNYRPLPENGKPKASFPSSHALLATYVFLCTAKLIPQYVKKDWLSYVLSTILLIICSVTVAGRLVSGVHWLTDILGAIILAFALYFGFEFAVSLSVEKQQKN